jgi:hypothetical protein
MKDKPENCAMPECDYGCGLAVIYKEFVLDSVIPYLA